MLKIHALIVVALLTVNANAVMAAISDFSTWQPIADPAHSGFSSTSTAGSASLFAFDQPIGAGVDVGFASINGPTVATSTSGYYFAPTQDFSLAIDYTWSFPVASTGLLGLGFGIGEDVAGENSAGVGLVANNGVPLLTFAGAARINDVDQDAVPLLTTPASLTGALFVSYEASSGDVTIGASPTIGASVAAESHTFSGIQNQWDGTDLAVSFFMRSDQQLIFSSWQGGQSEAVFSNFRVLSGAVTAIPEPSNSIVLLSLGLTLVFRRRR